jgi:hypothetical protein
VRGRIGNRGVVLRSVTCEDTAGALNRSYKEAG